MSLPYHLGNGWFGGFLPLIATAVTTSAWAQATFGANAIYTRPHLSDRGLRHDARRRRALHPRDARTTRSTPRSAESLEVSRSFGIASRLREARPRRERHDQRSRRHRRAADLQKPGRALARRRILLGRGRSRGPDPSRPHPRQQRRPLLRRPHRPLPADPRHEPARGRRPAPLLGDRVRPPRRRRRRRRGSRERSPAARPCTLSSTS